MKASKNFRASLAGESNFDGELLITLEGVRNCRKIQSWASEIVGDFSSFKEMLGKNLGQIGWAEKYFQVEAEIFGAFQEGPDVKINIAVYFYFPDDAAFLAKSEERALPIVEDIFDRFCASAEISFARIEERVKEAQSSPDPRSVEFGYLPSRKKERPGPSKSLGKG